jgi:hypothetical protein
MSYDDRPKLPRKLELIYDILCFFEFLSFAVIVFGLPALAYQYVAGSFNFSSPATLVVAGYFVLYLFSGYAAKFLRMW